MHTAGALLDFIGCGGRKIKENGTNGSNNLWYFTKGKKRINYTTAFKRDTLQSAFLLQFHWSKSVFYMFLWPHSLTHYLVFSPSENIS